MRPPRARPLSRSAVVAIAALIATGCAGEERLTLGFGVDPSAAEVATLVVDLEGDEHTIDRGDILVTRSVATEVGRYSVRLTLLDTAGAILAETGIEKRIREDHSNWLHVMVGTERPLSVCGLPDLAIDLDLTDAPADTMFVLSGSIPDDAIC